MNICQYLFRKAEDWIVSICDLIRRPRIIAERSTLFRFASTKIHRMCWGDSWYRSGVVVANDRGEFLLVEELRARIDGVWHDVEDMWNIPSGSCKEDEQFLDAAISAVLSFLLLYRPRVAISFQHPLVIIIFI